MDLLVPKIFKCSKYINTDIEKLWLHPENIKYNKIQITFAVKALQVSGSGLYDLLHNNIGVLYFVDSYMSDFSVMEHNRLSIYALQPHLQKKINRNTVLALHDLNKNFILDTANEIIKNPNLINVDYNYDLDTERVVMFGTQNKIIDESAFIDGYKPENLFLNKNSAQWRPYEVKFNPWQRGPGNKYTGSHTDAQTGKPNVENYNLYERVQRFYAPLDHAYLEEKTAIPKRMEY